jgi:hypothetical protein
VRGWAPQRVAITVRFRRIAVLAAIVLLVDLLGSFALAMMQPSNAPFGVGAVEWFRDNGAAWLVSDVESICYSLKAPATVDRISQRHHRRAHLDGRFRPRS